MRLHLITFLVDGDQPDVRDLADRVRAMLQQEWASGSCVQLIHGPSILAGAAVDEVLEEQ
jgi:hypothetical protein